VLTERGNFQVLYVQYDVQYGFEDISGIDHSHDIFYSTVPVTEFPQSSWCSCCRHNVTTVKTLIHMLIVVSLADKFFNFDFSEN
jgi:hypothetical protein